MATFVEQIKDFSAAVLAVVVARLLPTGGAAGQIPVKASATDGDVVWQTPSAASQADIEELEAKIWFFQ